MRRFITMVWLALSAQVMSPTAALAGEEDLEIILLELVDEHATTPPSLSHRAPEGTVKSSASGMIDLSHIMPRGRASHSGNLPEFTSLEAPILVELPKPTGAVKLQAATVFEKHGATVIGGTIKDVEGSLFTLTKVGSRVFGRIYSGLSMFEIEADARTGVAHLIEVDRTLIRRTPEPKLEPRIIGDHAQTGKSNARPKLVSPGNVQVQFLVTPQVASANYVPALVADIVASFNLTLVQSGADNFGNNWLENLGYAIVGSNFTGECFPTILNKLLMGLPPFQNFYSQIAHYQADVFFLLVSNEPTASCGAWGRVGGATYPGVNSGANFGASTDVYALGDLTAIHELGHMFGGRHSDTETMGGGTYESARGYTSSTDGWQTIMGGFTECPFQPLPFQTCTRIPRWSTPSDSYLGEPMGTIDYADMRSALSGLMPEAAAINTLGCCAYPQAPAVPTISATSGNCFGHNTVDWSQPAGAESYKLYRFNSLEARESTIVYDGTSNSHGVQVPQGATRYFAVKACNSLGCSSLSAKVEATHVPFCL